jgi:hypothetical protein
MPQILTDDTANKIQILVNELLAITHWDGAFWRCQSPHNYEIVAYVSRQKRRAEIIRELLRFSREPTGKRKESNIS